MRLKALALLLWVCTSATLWADDPGITFFEKKVRPVLANHCSKCHSEEKMRGKLLVDSRETLLHGGESGPAIERCDFSQAAVLGADNCRCS